MLSTLALAMTALVLFDQLGLADQIRNMPLGGFDKPRELFELLLEFRSKLCMLLVSPRGTQLLHLLG